MPEKLINLLQNKTTNSMSRWNLLAAYKKKRYFMIILSGLLNLTKKCKQKSILMSSIEM